MIKSAASAASPAAEKIAQKIKEKLPFGALYIGIPIVQAQSWQVVNEALTSWEQSGRSLQSLKILDDFPAIVVTE